MKKLLRLAAALCIGLLATVAGAASRTSELINRGWTFTLGNPAGAQEPGHDTRSWRHADLPHSFTEP